LEKNNETLKKEKLRVSWQFRCGILLDFGIGKFSGEKDSGKVLITR